MKGISLYSVIPVRTEAREGAEQSTQILFGETFDIIEQIPRWNRVKLHMDGQEGWVDAKMCTPMADKEFRTYQKDCQKAATVIFPMAYAVSENNGQTIPLTAGTKITKYQDGRFEVLGVGFRIEPSMVATAPLPMTQDNLLRTVRFFLNIPYLWGGKNAMGMDCSGFTQIIMSLFGVSMLRNASEQITQGELISSLSQAQAGDLVFFDHEGLNDGTAHPAHISHVGIVIDPERVIHCSGRVKVEKLDETGIYSAEQGAYTHHLAGIRRAFTR
jgi:cell wall-associated NlpC family hydrolase